MHSQQDAAGLGFKGMSEALRFPHAIPGQRPISSDLASDSAPPQPMQGLMQGLLSLLRSPIVGGGGLGGGGGSAEVQGITAAMSLTVALATAAGGGGGLPRQLLSVVSSFRSHMDEIRPLGKGGFGSVSLARSRLDGRLVAVKQV